MTLIVALKYKDGSILATDSRVIYGSIKRDQARKLERLTDNIAIAAAGLIGAIDDILKPVKEFCKSRPAFDDIFSFISDTTFDWFEKNSNKLDEEEIEGYAAFIVASPDRIRRITEKGYSEESYDYACDGSGWDYGEYILKNFYRENLDEEEAKELAVYTIVETSKMDPNVNEDIQLGVFQKDKQGQIISKGEIEDIKAKQAPLSKYAVEAQIKTVENLVKVREELNNLWEEVFDFKLLLQNEKAIFQIMKPCRSEGEFTNNIAALALLIDQLNIKELKKAVTEKDGSINILEGFLIKRINDFSPEIISNLRDITTMRSKRFPIHTTDSKFIEIVIRITGKYPPNWSDLYLKALDLYKESLNRLFDCLQKNFKKVEVT